MVAVLLVDDQPRVRQGMKMRLALEPDMVVVGEASDGVEALALAEALQPDVVVMDVEMPRLDGLSATAALLDNQPETHVVILSIHDNAVTRARADEAGATAFVGKHEGANALVECIRKVFD